MEDIKEYINSHYTSYHYNSDEIIKANNELIKYLKDTNKNIRKEWSL